MSTAEFQAAWSLGPKQGAVGVIAFTATSGETSLTTALGENPVGKYVTMISSANVYFAFSSGAAAAIDETSSTPGANANCYLLPAGVERSYVPTGSHITLKAPAEGSGNVRLFVGSP
jgi:hypothetical protein